MQKWSKEPVWQDLELARPSIAKAFKTIQNHGFVAEFRKIRTQSRFDMIGDWPILSLIVEEANVMGINPTRKVYRKALSETKDYKNWTKADKMHFTDLLMGLTEGTKSTFKPYSTGKNLSKVQSSHFPHNSIIY